MFEMNVGTSGWRSRNWQRRPEIIDLLQKTRKTKMKKKKKKTGTNKKERGTKRRFIGSDMSTRS